MPFDVIGFSEAAPGTGTPAIAVGLNDQIYRVSGDDIFIKDRASYLLGVLYAAESTPGYAELRQPSLKVPYNFLKSADINDPDPIVGFSNLLGRPMPLKAGEKLNAHSNNATDEDTLIGLLVGDGILKGEGLSPTHSLRGSADQTVTANSWTGVSMTWVNDLPAGEYAIVGMEYGAYIAAGFMLALARLIQKTESTWRPGVPVTQLAGDKLTLDAIADHPYTRWPLMRDVTLKHDLMPTFEVLSPAALTDHAVVLDLVKIG